MGPLNQKLGLFFGQFHFPTHKSTEPYFWPACNMDRKFVQTLEIPVFMMAHEHLVFKFETISWKRE